MGFPGGRHRKAPVNQPSRPVVSTVFSPAITAAPSHVAYCFTIRDSGSATRASGFVVFVDAHDDAGVAQILVRRNFEVVGRGLVLVDAAGQVERGAVTRTERSRPVRAARRRRPRFEVSGGRAAEVGTDADADEDLRLARAAFVFGVFGREAGALGVRIGQQRVAGISGRRAVRGAVDDHTGLPRHSTVFIAPTGMSPMSTSTGAPAARAFPRGKRADQRHGCCYTCYATDSTGGGYPETSRRIGRQIGVNRTVIVVMHQRILTHLPILVDAPALRVASLLRHRVRGKM